MRTEQEEKKAVPASTSDDNILNLGALNTLSTDMKDNNNPEIQLNSA